MVEQFSQTMLGPVVQMITPVVMPAMLFAFIFGVGIRMLIFYLAKIEARFTMEFDKRVRFHFATPDAPKVASFYRLSRILLEKTFLECFEVREKLRRRDPDHISPISDRLFLIQDGARRLVDDTLRHIRYLHKEGVPPKMVEVSKTVFEMNPYFNRLFGVFPVGIFNEILNILPGLFLIAGILGTFLGISKGLPELGAMDVGNVQETRRVMDLFLGSISTAMLKSILGIAFSAAMTLVNTMFSIEATYYQLINRYSNALEYVWNETTTNEVDHAVPAVPPTKAA